MESVDIIMEIVRKTDHLKGKYVKQTLYILEKSDNLNPEIRKAILDGFNNFSRALTEELTGYNLEQ